MRISDAHNDILTSGKSMSEIADYITEQSFDGHLRTLTMVYWTSGKDTPAAAIKAMQTFESLFCNIRLLFAIEDMGIFSPRDYYLLDKISLSYVSLTWNHLNRYGGGASSLGGLSKEGRNLLKILEEKKIPLDLSHLNKETFFDALDAYGGKVLCSHTCFSEVLEHPRNIDGGQIKAVREREGFIGIALVSDFLSPEKVSDSDDVLRHIDYYVQKYGAEGLGIGSDFFGTQNLPSNLVCYKEFSNLAKKMRGLGYSKEDVDGILYGNYRKFLGI